MTFFQKIISEERFKFSKSEDDFQNMKILWYGEYDETFEFVHSKIPCLEFMPMEVSLIIKFLMQ